ncbi:MAG TPA: Crp/Fnr family transcriptional regulator [Flavobacteriia bacterium]|nr:Crp/Fnr family transcriptional regulator [Flavobacteriia bacterium]
MNKEQSIDLISTNYSFLSPECKIELSAFSQILTFDKKTILVKEGQFATNMYFIVKGAARAYYLKDGKDVTDWFAFENDFICAINSFFLKIPSPHYIEVIEPSILLKISKEHIEKLSDKYREFDSLGKIIITKTMLQLQQRIVSIQFETASQKLESLEENLPNITQRVPLMHIASYLGITLETLSRIRNAKYRI